MRVAAISASSRSRLRLSSRRRDVVLPRAVGAAGGRDGKLARDQEVGGEAVGDGLHLARLAELVHVLRQDDLHAIELLHCAGWAAGRAIRASRGAAAASAGSAATRVGRRSGRARDAPDGSADRARARTAGCGRRPHRRRRAGCPASSSFSASSVVVEAVEEQLDREGHDDQVVELAEDRHASGTMSRPSDDVAERAARASPCARRASGSSRRATTSAGRTAARGRRAAGTRRRRSSGGRRGCDRACGAVLSIRDSSSSTSQLALRGSIARCARPGPGV